MHPHEQTNEELAGMFARTMQISNPTPPPEIHFHPPQPESTHQTQQTAHAEPIVYASMHYTHTRHVVPVRFHATPETTPEPQLPHTPLTDDDMISILTMNGIDPHSLVATQVELLRHADPQQQQRLIELWRMSPPSTATYDVLKQQMQYTTSTMQQEEEMAHLRQKRLADQQLFSPSQRSISSDPELVQLEDAMSASIGHTRQGPTSVPERPASAPGIKTYAEPYMMSGYEMLAKRDYEAQAYQPLRETNRYNQATDPVYIGPGLHKGREEAENVAMPQDEEMEL